MSRKNVCRIVLLTLVCWALLALPASAQHFQQVKGTLLSVAAGRNEVFGGVPGESGAMSGLSAFRVELAMFLRSSLSTR